MILVIDVLINNIKHKIRHPIYGLYIYVIKSTHMHKQNFIMMLGTITAWEKLKHHTSGLGFT
jgi:hypothetical protein